jgi:hypothetical protein
MPVALCFLSDDSGLAKNTPMPGQGGFRDAEVSVAAAGTRLGSNPFYDRTTRGISQR